MIPVFVISLLRAQERRLSVVRQMTHHCIDFEFVDAVDGKQITDQELQKVNFDLAQKLGHKLSMGEIGCALSHITIYEMIIAKNIDKCIILEDDAYLHINFKSIVEKIIKIDHGDIVFLHHGKAKSWPIYRGLPEGYRFAKYISPSKKSKRGIFSAAGYLLTKKGAEILLSKAYPIRMPADYLTGMPQLTGISAYGVEPSCIDVGLFKTTIDDRNYGQYVE